MPSRDLENRISVIEKRLATFSQELHLALSYVEPDAASSLTKSRLVLEKLLVQLYIAETGHEPRKPLLGDMLADNQFTRKLERRILSRMNAIRDMGNLGPHGEAVRPTDAARVLDDLCEVLEWCLQRYVGNAPAGTDAGAGKLSRTSLSIFLPPEAPAATPASACPAPVGPADEAVSGAAKVAPAQAARPPRWARWLVVTLLLGGVAAFWWHQGPGADPLMELRRQEIEREVAHLLSRPPALSRTQAADYREADALDPFDYAPFHILSDDRVTDLRAWAEVPPDKLHELQGAVCSTRRIRLTKAQPAAEFAAEGRTSGLDLYWNCLSPFRFRVLGQKGDVFVGQDRMKSRRIAVDVSTVPVGEEFELRLVMTYWNSLQTEREQWLGAIGYEGAFKVSMLLLFPADRPFKDFSLMTAQTARDRPGPYRGPRIILEGAQHHWLYWEIPRPEAGRVYQVHWSW